MTLRIIDVSSAQGLIQIAPIDCDGVIAKATGGNNYVNDCCDFVIQQCYKLNRASGFYHYAHEFGNINDPVKEADFFIANTENYFGKSVPFLDYEVAINGHNYTSQDVEWCRQWLQHVKDRTGVTPLLYISKSLISATDWTPVTNMSVAGWIAQYANNNYTGWQNDPWTDSKPFAPFSVALYQYTSHGRINGYNGDLDLSIFYGDRNAWNKYATVNKPMKPTPVTKPEPKPVDYLTLFAKDVIAGKYGNGNQRKENIYNAVQQRVNELTK